jgi:hypothetical protein
MKHTVEIADSQGKTMLFSINHDVVGFHGSWRSLTKGMIRFNSGSMDQHGSTSDGVTMWLKHDNTWGIKLYNYTRWGTANDEGTGLLVQSWVLTLEPGPIEWSLAD